MAPALSHARIELIETGMSDASVFRLGSSHYLKIAQHAAAQDLRDEIERTAWLGQQGVRIAPAVRVHDGGDFVALLSEALTGTSVDETDLSPEIVVPALARALSALHAVPVVRCPFDESIAARLERAGTLVDNRKVDPRAFAPRNRDVTPGALLERLRRTVPSEDVVVVHGDATLSNMIVGDDLSVSFIDCGHAGRADPYVDLAPSSPTAWQSGSVPPSPTASSCAYGSARWIRKPAISSTCHEFFSRSTPVLGPRLMSTIRR